MIACAVLMPVCALPAADGEGKRAIREWMRDEGVIASSDMEALTFYLRLGGAATDVENRWHRERGPEAVARLKAAGVNLAIINFHKGAGLIAESEDIAAAKQFVELAHKHGIKVAGYVGASMFYETFFAEEPNARDWIQVDENGRPNYYTNEQSFRYMACRNNPGYRAFVRKVIEAGIRDAKLDILHFDQMQWWAEPRSCRCKYCAEEFRQFLRARYRDPRAARSRFGFTNFDHVIPPPYGDATAPVQIRELRNPMMQEWTIFRAWNLAQRMGEFDDYIRQLNPNAGLIGNPTMSPERNVGFAFGVDLAQLAGHADAIWSEEPSLPQWTEDGRLPSQIRSYKAVRGLGGTLLAWQNLGKADVYKKTPAELRLACSLAYNDANLGVVAGSDTGFFENSPEMRRYARFFREHIKDLRHTEPVADAAVLRSFASTEFNPAESNFETVLAEQALIQHKIPFGILFDGRIDDLGKYKVLVLADQDALSDTQITRIRRFVSEGGGLVATWNTSMLDEWRRRRPKFGLADVFGIDAPYSIKEDAAQVRRQFGKGRVVYIPRMRTDVKRPSGMSPIPNALWKLPANAGEFAEAVRWAAGGALSLNAGAPLWVTAELARQEETGTYLLHLVNFRLHEKLKDIPVEVRVPAGLRVRSAEAVSPDAAAGAPLTVGMKDGVAKFTVPSLDVYSLVILRMEKAL